jgi:hypothetical protein
MPQIVGTPPITGHQIAEGPNRVGQISILTGAGDPNTISDFDGSRPGVVSAAVGSLFLRQDAPDATHALYVKTAMPNTWTPK